MSADIEATCTLPDPPDARAWARNAWRVLRAAVRGEHIDLTAAPIGKALLMLAVPMILEMVMESVFALVDVFWVSHLGPQAVAAVGLTETMMMIIYAVAMGVAIGVMALVARRIGEKDPDAAARTATQGIALGLMIALTVGAAGAIFAPDLLRLMGADAGIVATGSNFTAVMLGGNATVLLLFLINAVFRGAGDAALAMRALWLGNLLNIALGPLFVFGVGPFPELGVTGAAVATTIGRGCAVVFQLYLLWRGRSKVAIKRRHLGLDGRLMVAVLRIASSAVLQMLIVMTSYVGVMRVLAGFGSAPLAGYTIGFRILMFAMLPCLGVANAAATLVGQNLGAGRPDRAEQSVWKACLVAAGFLSAIAILFIAAAPALISLFTSDPTVRDHGVTYLRIIGFGFPFYAFGMVISSAFNGAGDTRTPTLINLFVFWILQLPLAWFLSRHTTLGPSGVYITLGASFSVFAAIGVTLFRRGAWKQTRV